MSKWRNLLAFTAVAVSLSAAPAFADKLGLGREALPEEISAWDVVVLPDGTGLRPGSGDVATGEDVFGEKCAACHGEFAEGLDSWPALSGGEGTLTDRRPVKTMGSYWPYLSTAWDYIHRSMPFGEAQTISVDDTYAIVAFLLYSNGLVEDDFVLSNENFKDIAMPNADGFYADDRPQTEYPKFTVEPCMTACSAPVKVTKRAVELNVTPTDPDGRPAGTLPTLNVAQAAAPAAAPETAPETAVAATVDPAVIEAGKNVFKKCAACHKVGEGAKNGVGPHLNGIVDAAAGKGEGFKYSKVLADKSAAGLVWSDAELDAFLADPKSYMKGTKMSFVGLKKTEERTAVIEYLRSLAN